MDIEAEGISCVKYLHPNFSEKLENRRRLQEDETALSCKNIAAAKILC